MNKLDILAKRKVGDTVFILGSGDSINSVTDAEWKLIKSKNSIGFNYFFIHDFIPDIYFFETPKNELMMDLACDVLKRRKEQYSKIPFILHYKHFKEATRNKIRESFGQFIPSGNIILNTPDRYLTNDEGKLRFLLLREFRRSPVGKPGQLIHYGATISFLVMFAHIIGFKKIVLMGVDLNGSRYFYENSEYLKDVKVKKFVESLVPVENKNVHLTADRAFLSKSGQIPIQEYLELFQSVILTPAGSQIFTGSETSLLSEYFPVYKFEK